MIQKNMMQFLNVFMFIVLQKKSSFKDIYMQKAQVLVSYVKMKEFFFLNMTKKVKLNVYMNSENNATYLAPMLSQYNMKPVDFMKMVEVKSFDEFKIEVNSNVSKEL